MVTSFGYTMTVSKINLQCVNAHDIAPLNGCTYMLTVLYEKHQYVSNQCMSANGQSHLQSQTRLLFVTTLEVDNFDYTIMMNAYFINSQLVLGGAHSLGKHTLLAP